MGETSDLFENKVGVASEKNYFKAEKDLFTFPYITEYNTIIEKGKTLSKYIIYNTKNIKKHVVQYDIEPYKGKIKKNKNKHWDMDDLSKPLNMLWENPNFSDSFTP